MLGRRTEHATQGNTVQAAAAAGMRPVVVRSIRRFRGVHEVTWRDGRHRRRILVVIDRWVDADDTVREAVAQTYPPADRPTIIVPAQAWR